MFDLHILNDLDSTNPRWLAECLKSAERAADLLGCTVHVIDDPGPHIGHGRARGFARGDEEFVACLDNDDVLIPEEIPELLATLSRHPEVCGVYSDRQQIDDHGKVIFTLNRPPWDAVDQICQTDYPHQFAIYRRAAIEPHLAELEAFPTYSEYVLSGLATAYGPWRHVPGLAYQRREKSYYIRHRRRIDAATHWRARQLAIPKLIAHLR